MNTTHGWRFYRAGGFDQVRLDSGADLAALDHLDQKLWVALSCPTRGVEIDAKTLDLIDTDKDGRLRPPEVLAATRWACACLKNPNDLLKSAAALPLAAITEDTPEGKQLLAAARQVLTNLGKTDAAVLTVDDTSDMARIFAQTVFNGDGIIPAEQIGPLLRVWWIHTGLYAGSLAGLLWLIVVVARRRRTGSKMAPGA